MLDAAREAVSFIQDKSRGSLEKDRKLVLALVKAIEIIGEAAVNVTKECREDLPGIPWTNITGMRYRLIHVYFDINLDVLWHTITEDLKPLIKELEKILSRER